jgi:hypothetical protein
MKHNNKFHTEHNKKTTNKCQNILTENKNLSKNSQNILTKNDKLSKCQNNITDNESIQNVCQKCNKQFNSRQAKWYHEKKCKDNSIDELKKENNEMKKQISEIKKMESKMEEMKNMIAELLKTRKIHPKTLQKINNNLVNNGYINSNNNTTIIKFGSININNVLTEKEVLSILYKPFVSTEECVKLIHFNEKRPQYNNIFITNLKDDLAYVYDGNKFVTATKNDVIMELINNYSDQVEISFEENRDKIPESKIKCVENYINLINNEKPYIDQHNKVYPNFKTYKIGDVKRLIYDKSDPKKFAIICKNIQNVDIEV